MQTVVLVLVVALFAVVLALLWRDARRQLGDVDETTAPSPPHDMHGQRLDSIERAVQDLKAHLIPPRPIPVVELWLMDQNEQTVEHTVHVATRLRTPEVIMDGCVYNASRETQPGYWIYRRAR